MAPTMDRDETLRRAELLLRQGRPDAAAEEYARVAAAHPGDLATANALGDLYVRLQRTDLAVPLYLRVGDIYLREGFFAKAAAFYKKVLKYQPDSESVLFKLAEACRAQGLRVEARGCLQAVLQQAQRRSDPGTIDEVLVRLADNEPSDLDAASAAVPARARLLGADAIPSLLATANVLEAAGRQQDAERARRLVAILTPRAAPGDDDAALGADGAAPSTASTMEGHAPSCPPGTAPEGQPGDTPFEPRNEPDAQWALDAVFARMRRVSPDAAEPAPSRLALAETYLAAGLDSDAVPLLEALAADEATSDRAAFLMARVCERQGRFADAARWMTAALEAGLADAAARSAALRRLGDLYERLREPARALEAWREARSLAADPGELDDRIARVSAAVERGGGPFTR